MTGDHTHEEQGYAVVTTFSVNTTAQLISALSKAVSGDKISVASGTYSNVRLNNINVAGNVTIESANANKPAIFTDLTMKNSRGLTLRGLEFSATDGKMYGFNIASSSNIVLDKLSVHGTMNGDPGDDISPMMIRGSTNVTVSNSEFQQAWHALSFLDNDGLKIVNNSFHDIRTDAVRGGGTSNLVISGNHFTDFYPKWGASSATGDHPDAIQLWTTGTTKSASNITITDNVITRGNGDPVQGIFVRDQVGTLPYQNMTVTGNTVVGGLDNGISIGSTDGLTVTNNNVVGIDGQKSNIRIQSVTNATVANNEATGYLYIDADGASKSANVLADFVSTDLARTIAGSVAGLARNTKLAATADGLIDKLVTLLGYADAPPVAARAFAEQVVSGTAGDDRLSATSVGNSRVEGGAGNDVLTGGMQGSHTLVGGAGDDTYIIRFAGNNVVETADGGNDTVTAYIDYTLGAHVENLRLIGDGLTGTGNELDNRIVGSAGNDIMYGLAGDDTLQGGDGDDRLDGGDGNDLLRGDAGNDTLIGGNGNDTLIGGEGNDILLGGNGNDVLEGGAGNDTMTGGAGADIFRFRAADVGQGGFDTITDFQRGTDKIDLSPIDAKAATAANDAFSFIGTASFTKKAGELRYDKIGGDAFVYGDVNGDGVADFAIVLKGVGALAAADFTL